MHITPKKGYTLIEILIVITIFAIVASFILLSVSGLGKNHELQQTADQLIQRLEFARDEAILRNHPIAFEKIADGYRFSELINKQWQALTAGPLARIEKMPRDITLSKLHSDQVRVIFTPSDNLTNLVLVLSAYKDKIQITQDPRGHFQSLSIHE